MDNKERQQSYNFYIIVGLLFLLVIILWAYLGEWRQTFRSAGQGANFNLDVSRLWEDSRAQYAKLAPSMQLEDVSKESIANSMLDKALEKSIIFNDVEVRYPKNWVEVPMASTSTSTLNLISTSGEWFYFDNMPLVSTADPIAAWHKQKSEDVLGWSWQKIGAGLVGVKVDREDVETQVNQARIVGLFPVSSTTMIVIERQSREKEKIKDGLLEVLLNGLRK